LLSKASRAALATYPDDWPELEYLSLSVYLGWQTNSRYGNPHDDSNYASLAVTLVTPQSRGNLTITSADTSDPSYVINPNFLSSPVDVEPAVAEYKRVRQFLNTTAMQPFLVGL
jgi:choline dehydrogenase